MDVVRYLAACALAGPHLLRPRPRPQLVGNLSGAERNAVYIVVDVTGAVVYVGSTCGRPARRRIAEHLADPVRTRRWHEVWVLPLRRRTSLADVRRLEGLVGRSLGYRGCLPARGPAHGRVGEIMPCYDPSTSPREEGGGR